MTFHPRMHALTRGFTPIDPLRVLWLDGIVADLWHVECASGAAGHYTSPDPRLVILLDDGGLALGDAPSVCAAGGPISFVPAGVALWGRAVRPGRLRHLDIHFRAETLARLIHGAGADRPILMARNDRLVTLAGLLADQCHRPDRPPAYATALIAAMLADLFAGPAARHGLSTTALTAVTDRIRADPGAHMSVADLADVAGLPPSTFARAFKAATGLPPHRWQMRERVDQAKARLATPAPLAEIAADLGFADQAHFCRVFRKATGSTPLSWRHRRFRPNPDRNDQDSDIH